MIRCSLEEKNLIIEFLTSELDHHITNEVRDEIDIILDSKSSYLRHLFKILVDRLISPSLFLPSSLMTLTGQSNS